MKVSTTTIKGVIFFSEVIRPEEQWHLAGRGKGAWIFSTHLTKLSVELGVHLKNWITSGPNRLTAPSQKGLAFTFCSNSICTGFLEVSFVILRATRKILDSFTPNWHLKCTRWSLLLMYKMTDSPSNRGPGLDLPTCSLVNSLRPSLLPSFACPAFMSLPLVPPARMINVPVAPSCIAVCSKSPGIN